jgi:hypothetical protein
MKLKKLAPYYDLPALERAAHIRKLPGFKLIIAGGRDIDTEIARKLIREHWEAVHLHTRRHHHAMGEDGEDEHGRVH